MRYRPEHKQASRKAILDAAARAFRAGGFAGVGVDRLAGAAGLTSGAFYKHFRSKLEAFRDVVQAGVERVIRRVRTAQEDHLGDPDAAAWIEEFIGAYMSKAHRLAMAAGCALPTLTADVARSTRKTRGAFEKGLLEAAELMATRAPFQDRDGFERAIAILALVSGGTALARAVADAATADRIAAAVRRAASQLAHGDLEDARPPAPVTWAPSK